MLLNNLVTGDNVKRSEALQASERIDPLTPESMFSGLVYVILSARERYTTQKSMYDRLISRGITDAAAMRSNRDVVKSLIKGLSKSDYVLELADTWQDSGFPGMIIDDYQNGRVKEFDIRNRLAKDIHGISYKCASLFMNMCGYQRVVVLDNWALRAIVEAGYDVKSYYYEPKDGKEYKNHYSLGKNRDGKEIFLDSGITGLKSYTLYESYFTELASKNNLSPFEFKQLLWVKHSTWLERSGNDPIQLQVDFPPF